MPDKKRIVVAGATGMIGSALSRRLIEKGYSLVVFTRSPDAARITVPGAAEYVAWQPEVSAQWDSAIDGAYGVVNLAGAPFSKNGPRSINARFMIVVFMARVGLFMP
jgi:uncharacterized protein